MNTFLPFSDFLRSVACLDKRRCLKQVVEAKQILDILRGDTTSKAWKNHPCVLIWRNYDDSLAYYFNVCQAYCAKHHGVNWTKIKPAKLPQTSDVVMPWWLGLKAIHYSHRCNLVRKAHTDLAKGRDELLKRLIEQGVSTRLPLLTKYVWAINKDGTPKDLDKTLDDCNQFCYA